MWYYRFGVNRICSPYSNTKKNEALRTAMEYGRCEKQAATKDFFNEQAMGESNRRPEISSLE
jgi:hypothetical protein